KFVRRQELCSVMMNVAIQEGDTERLQFWTEVLQCTQILTADGMSDEEDGEKDGEPVRYVHELDFRHPDLQILFGYLDNIRETENMIFNTVGRKRLCRIHSGLVQSECAPPVDLPPAYYKPSYLQLMTQGKVPSVRLAE
ncbi:hypothetical protein K435DRAFT_617596, partial [Dendrothele bispora CBS 962.96]